MNHAEPEGATDFFNSLLVRRNRHGNDTIPLGRGQTTPALTRSWMWRMPRGRSSSMASRTVTGGWASFMRFGDRVYD